MPTVYLIWNFLFKKIMSVVSERRGKTCLKQRTLRGRQSAVCCVCPSSEVPDGVCLRETAGYLYSKLCLWLLSSGLPVLGAKLGAPGHLDPMILWKNIAHKEGYPHGWDEVRVWCFANTGTWFPLVSVTCVTVDR